MPPTDLGQLLDRAAHGDADAFADFYDATIAGAYRLARISLTDSSRVDHVLRLSYVRAWYEVERYPTSGRSPQAWLMGLVQDSAKTTRRRARPRRGRTHRGPAAQATLI